MRFSVTSLLTFSSLAFSLPIEQQPNANPTETAIQQTTRGLKTLSNSLNALTARNADVVSLSSQIMRNGNGLTSIMREGAYQVRRGPDLNVNEALFLTQPVNDMITQTQQTTQSWSASKRIIIGSGGKTVTLNILNDHLAAAAEFSDAMVAKMPALAKSTAQLYGTRAKMLIETAINEFKRS
ncbi:hypothetical protein EJ06DRAFT_549771 [Trichodelitschia bisporula]|uniref:Cell wall protein n=1 Tax=Trichodelitschia bisporula TaxID=703511 RepID=A0A6G1HSN0_9PEZI|nr:hypothetical protein EJ06DRAFT_549771 [Trichodelitschia bisporula]